MVTMKEFEKESNGHFLMFRDLKRKDSAKKEKGKQRNKEKKKENSDNKNHNFEGHEEEKRRGDEFQINFLMGLAIKRLYTED